MAKQRTSCQQAVTCLGIADGNMIECLDLDSVPFTLLGLASVSLAVLTVSVSVSVPLDPCSCQLFQASGDGHAHGKYGHGFCAA